VHGFAHLVLHRKLHGVVHKVLRGMGLIEATDHGASGQAPCSLEPPRLPHTHSPIMDRHWFMERFLPAKGPGLPTPLQRDAEVCCTSIACVDQPYGDNFSPSCTMCVFHVWAMSSFRRSRGACGDNHSWSPTRHSHLCEEGGAGIHPKDPKWQSKVRSSGCHCSPVMHNSSPHTHMCVCATGCGWVCVWWAEGGTCGLPSPLG
jgi:hypothetical protein